jgi:hypothetical protein
MDKSLYFLEVPRSFLEVIGEVLGSFWEKSYGKDDRIAGPSFGRQRQTDNQLQKGR